MKNPLIRCLVTAALLLILSALPACAGGQGFIEDYESLNGQPVPNHPGSVYQTLRIAEKPPVVRITAQEAAALSGERVLLYLGATWCPWCRNALPSLMAAADAEGFPRIYYVDMTEERDLFEVIGGEPVKIREGTPGYRLLLNRLETFLPDYTVTAPDGTVYGTGEKRIYLPTLACLRGGSFTSVLQPSFAPDEGKTAYDPLSDEQRSRMTEQIIRWLRGGVGE